LNHAKIALSYPSIFTPAQAAWHRSRSAVTRLAATGSLAVMTDRSYQQELIQLVKRSNVSPYSRNIDYV
jgi:hypothetical protein